ncbi:MAG: S41 family peptidase [Alphaproteobacteria bacterium]|nr:S41 family peptidase [Alphaproteobacteria bacterium]MDE2337038.1 S41 family peptidase [Alphaproteobacteria bacterium]
MNKRKALKLALAAAALLVCSSLTVIAAENGGAGQDASAETYKQLNLFGDVFEMVRADYVDPISDKKLIEYALNGMLSSLDPHSSYMNAKEAKAMDVENTGEFGGLGIEVTMANGVIKVISPIDDTPAAHAGIQSGDLIIEIDGKPVTGMSLNDAVNKMRGKVGSKILLTIIRKGEKAPLKITLTRAVIQIKSVKHRVINGNVGYIRITMFNAQTAPGMLKAFKDIKKKTDGKLIGYVLDLRNNPGGLLDQAIATADDFLNKGEIVSTRGRNPDDTRADYATPGDLADGLPVIVLINGGSASASEIVSGALQDNHRAIVVGTQSFGKGSVQTLFNVPGGGMVRLTTARYFTPSGRSIQAEGITPDIVIKPAKIVADSDPFPEIHEADLIGALKNPDGTPAEKKTDDADENTKLESDYQLLRAVDLLQGISLYKSGMSGIAQKKVSPAKEKKNGHDLNLNQ